MNRIMVLLAMTVLLGAGGCTTLTGVEDPGALERRADVLRSEAAAFRRDAREIDALIDKTEGALKTHRLRLETLQPRKQDIVERLEQLRTRQEELPPQQAEELQSTMRRYRDRLEAVQSAIDDQKTKIMELHDQLKAQQRLRAAYLQKAREADRTAQQLEERIQQLAEHAHAPAS
jgi:chromosome segregation ATPase